MIKKILKYLYINYTIYLLNSNYKLNLTKKLSKGIDTTILFKFLIDLKYKQNIRIDYNILRNGEFSDEILVIEYEIPYLRYEEFEYYLKQVYRESKKEVVESKSVKQKSNNESNNVYFLDDYRKKTYRKKS